ncbi:MAG: hypothetical protein JW983_04855 [Elusimicrobia bacterium]|nr:hypothetical protein [Elusimicrobiota bacterium]
MPGKKIAVLMIFITLSILHLGLIELTAKSGNLSAVLKKMANKFSESYKSVPDAVVPGVLAVFPFQADEKLTKRKVDFAVGEMFTLKLIETGTFKVVERVELQRLLEEQKLGLTGVIETESAVKAGKLLGARLLVMGSITRMGKSYQINTRLVDARTGEVISIDFAEVDVKTFEEEAKPYITLVPEKQAIGLQIAAAFLPVSISAGGARSFSATYGTDPVYSYSAVLTPDKSNASTDLIGIGARYMPVSWLALEGVYYFTKELKLSMVADYAASSNYIADVNLNLNLMRLGGSYVHKFGSRFRGYAGMHLLFAMVTDADGGGNSQQLDHVSGPSSIPLALLTDDDGGSFAFTMLRLGMEWRPQERVGLSLFGNSALGKVENQRTVIIDQTDGARMVAETEMDFVTLKVEPFFLEAAFSFYF